MPGAILLVGAILYADWTAKLNILRQTKVAKQKKKIKMIEQPNMNTIMTKLPLFSSMKFAYILH